MADEVWEKIDRRVDRLQGKIDGLAFAKKSYPAVADLDFGLPPTPETLEAAQAILDRADQQIKASTNAFYQEGFIIATRPKFRS